MAIALLDGHEVNRGLPSFLANDGARCAPVTSEVMYRFRMISIQKFYRCDILRLS